MATEGLQQAMENIQENLHMAHEFLQEARKEFDDLLRKTQQGEQQQGECAKQVYEQGKGVSLNYRLLPCG